MQLPLRAKSNCYLLKIVLIFFMSLSSNASFAIEISNDPNLLTAPRLFDILASQFFSPQNLVLDKNCNAYFIDNGTVRKISVGGDVSTIAGKAGVFGYVDGNGDAARFGRSRGLAIDKASNLYVVDANAIRKMTPNGVVTTIAGSPNAQGDQDGQGTAARFAIPNDIAVDVEGNLFVADLENYLIRKITPDNIVSTFSGIKGGQGSYVDGSITIARFAGPHTLTFDQDGNLYVLDAVFPPSNFFIVKHIRKISYNGIVTTIISNESSLEQVQEAGKKLQAIKRKHCDCLD